MIAFLNMVIRAQIVMLLPLVWGALQAQQDGWSRTQILHHLVIWWFGAVITLILFQMLDAEHFPSSRNGDQK